MIKSGLDNDEKELNIYNTLSDSEKSILRISMDDNQYAITTVIGSKLDRYMNIKVEKGFAETVSPPEGMSDRIVSYKFK